MHVCFIKINNLQRCGALNWIHVDFPLHCVPEQTADLLQV